MWRTGWKAVSSTSDGNEEVVYDTRTECTPPLGMRKSREDQRKNENSNELYIKWGDDPSSVRSKNRRRKWLILHIAGIVLSAIGLCIYLIDPSDAWQKRMLKISPGSFFLGYWKDPPVGVYCNVYIFNVTNAESFLAGKEKLRLEEIGPFVYMEYLNNHNVTFNENNTMTYTPKRSVIFQPHLSVGDPKKLRVIVPNIGLLGLSTMIANRSMFINLGFLPSIKYFGSEPFLNLTVEEYFWGYDEPLLKIAHALFGGWITFDKMGLLDRMYDEGENRVTIRLTDNELPTSDPAYLPQYSVDNWNGSPGHPVWGYRSDDENGTKSIAIAPPEEKCKYLKGATEGVVFPRKFETNYTFYVYRKIFCRHLPLVFNGTSVKYKPGVDGDFYGFSDNVFDPPPNNAENECYCLNKERCLPRGLTDVTPCMFDIPISISFPHFYKADPKLLEDIDGLTPNEEKHETYTIRQPGLGISLKSKCRFQGNLHVGHMKYHKPILPFSNLVIPVFWTELISDDFTLFQWGLVYGILYLPPVLVMTAIILGAVSATLLVISAIYHYFTRIQKEEMTCSADSNFNHIDVKFKVLAHENC